jgi:uncharacterized protein YbbC (DUF1343 family)
VPTYFRPQFHKHAGEVCGGVEIRVTDVHTLRPYRCGIELIAAVSRVAPEQFSWRRQPYEFVSEHPAIDLLTGDTALRESLEKGETPIEWIESWALDVRQFREDCEDILIYPGVLSR